MIKTDGEVVWSARYDSFGNTIIDKEVVKNNLRFSGQYYDSESGLHYNWNRYYDPFLGRYLQTDPLGLDAGMNYFVYCNGNPVNMIDPMGLILSAGELGFGNPGSYGSHNTDESMYGSNGLGTGNDYSSRDDSGTPVGPTNTSSKVPNYLDPDCWADTWKAAIMRAEGRVNPFENRRDNYVEAIGTPEPVDSGPRYSPLSRVNLTVDPTDVFGEIDFGVPQVSIQQQRVNDLISGKTQVPKYKNPSESWTSEFAIIQNFQLKWYQDPNHPIARGFDGGQILGYAASMVVEVGKDYVDIMGMSMIEGIFIDGIGWKFAGKMTTTAAKYGSGVYTSMQMVESIRNAHNKSIGITK